MQATGHKDRIKPGLHRFGHHSLQRMDIDRRANAHHVGDSRRGPRDRAQHLGRGDVAPAGSHAGDASALGLDAQHFGFLMDLDAAPVGAAAVSPGHCVMTRDGARCVIERAEDRCVTAAGKIHLRTGLLDFAGPDQFAVDAEVFVNLGTPAHGAHGRIGMRQRKVAARRVKKIQVEIGREVLPEPNRCVIESHPFRRKVIRSDDGGIAAGVAPADVTFLQYRHIPYPVVFREIVSGGQPMPASAYDYDVVAGLQPLRCAEHARLRITGSQGKTQQSERHEISQE